jgi:RNA polymerase sigma-70 factor (ECF subfamily)
MTEETFIENINLIIDGDKSGLKSIYDEYLSMVYSVVFSIVKNKHSAEDIASEVFIKIWDKAESYKYYKGHKGWILTIAHNSSIDYIRKNKKVEYIDNLALNEIVSELSFEKEICNKISIENALNNLKDNEREIVSLHILGDLTFREISKILNKPLGTVTWNYHNAVKTLRRCEF